MNEDGEGLQISGDRDCELCAGNKQGGDREISPEREKKVCGEARSIEG